jgi:hypothetical protein
VENAAILSDKYEGTKDGWELSCVHSIQLIYLQLTKFYSLQVNDLSTPLVSFLLLPAMIKTAQQHATLPRIVVVSSEVHYWVEIEKRVYENPDIIKTLGSSEYCTDSYALVIQPQMRLA